MILHLLRCISYFISTTWNYFSANCRDNIRIFYIVASSIPSERYSISVIAYFRHFERDLSLFSFPLFFTKVIRKNSFTRIR